MLERLGIFILEEASGKVSVQLFQDPDKGQESFVNLTRLTGNEIGRATYVKVNYQKGRVHGRVKSLPELEDKEKKPDGFELGKGPVWFDQKEDNDGKGKVTG